MDKTSLMLLPLLLAFELANAGLATTSETFERADALARSGQSVEAEALLGTLGTGKDVPGRALALRIYLLADSQRSNAALSLASDALATHRENAAVWLAQGYAQRRAGKPTHALTSFQHVLKLDPTNKDALVGQAMALHEMGSEGLAWAAAQNVQGLLPDRAFSDIRRGYAVELLRAARTESSEQGRAELAEAVNLLRAETVLDAKTRADLVVALNASQRHAEAVATFKDGNGDVGWWAWAPAASSMGAVEQQDEGVALLEQGHAKFPDRLEVTYALVYAYSDALMFEKAWALADRVVEQLEQEGSAERVFANQLQAQVRIWAGATAAGGRLLEAAVGKYPRSEALKLTYASWLVSAGRSRSAIEQYDAVLSLNPDSLDGQLGKQAVQGELSPAAARVSMAELRARYPSNPLVARAQRDADKTRRAYVYAEARTNADRDSKSSTRAVEVGSPALGPFATRLYAERLDTTNSLREGDVSQAQSAVGVQQPLGAGWHAAVAATQAVGKSNEVGIRLKMSGSLTEASTVVLRASTNEFDVPARAYVQGVTAKSTGIAWNWAPEVDVHTGVSYSQTWLSDDNVRRSLSGSVGGTYHEAAQYGFSWRLALGWDTASSQSVSYFSPKSDFWTEANVRLDPPPVLRIGQDIRVRVSPVLAIGSYRQVGFAPLPTYSAGLATNWALTSHVSVELGYTALRRPYDGVQTTQHLLQASLFSRLP